MAPDRPRLKGNKDLLAIITKLGRADYRYQDLTDDEIFLISYTLPNRKINKLSQAQMYWVTKLLLEGAETVQFGVKTELGNGIWRYLDFLAKSVARRTVISDKKYKHHWKFRTDVLINHLNWVYEGKVSWAEEIPNELTEFDRQQTINQLFDPWSSDTLKQFNKEQLDQLKWLKKWFTVGGPIEDYILLKYKQTAVLDRAVESCIFLSKYDGREIVNRWLENLPEVKY